MPTTEPGGGMMAGDERVLFQRANLTPEGIKVEDETLTRIKYIITSTIDRDLVKEVPDAVFDAAISDETEWMRNALVIRMRGRVLGKLGAFELVFAGYPTPWWHLFARYAPQWLQRRVEPRKLYAVLRAHVMYPNLKEGTARIDWVNFGTYRWPEQRSQIEAYRAGRGGAGPSVALP